MKVNISIKILSIVLTSVLFYNPDCLSQKNMPDLSSLDSIVFQLYDVISGEKGEARDWDLMRALFTDNAQLIYTDPKLPGTPAIIKMSVEDYILKSGPYLVANGFYEKEINRIIERFGNICHIFSTYETYHSIKEAEPFARGINSIQLLYDDNRWWIVNIYWQSESEDFTIPEKYLPD